MKLTESPQQISQTISYDASKSDPLQISDIRIELPAMSKKSIKAAEVIIDGDIIPAKWLQTAGSSVCWSARLKFDPPRSLSAGSQLSVEVHLMKSKFIGEKRITESAKVSADTLIAAIRTSKLAWSQNYGDMTISINGGRREMTLTAPPMEPAPSNASIRTMTTLGPTPGSPTMLVPTTEEILEQCPRFRILVMGKTGAGKSLLINKTFGVSDAFVADNEVGFADIDREIYSEDNPHFVLHDSMGFELGDDENVETVQRFVLERSDREPVGDKLHAIWLCIAIPVSGGRLLEKGVEDFLREKLRSKLGKVPIIVVFTKYDLLYNHVKMRMDLSLFEGLEKTAIDELVDNAARDQLNARCIKPFEDKIRSFQEEILAEGITDSLEDKTNVISSIYVCSKDNRERNLAELVQLTYDRVQEYFTEAATVSAMAQRVSPLVKIKASIAVGRKKYWARLARSLAFKGHSLLQCVDVIHADIVNVWGFHDPKNYLASKEFKALMSKLVDKDDSLRHIRSAHRAVPGGVSMVAGLAGIFSSVAAVTVAAPIVVPIAAAFVFAKWVNDMYQHTTFVLERLMTYIVDLSLVLQNIFWLQAFREPGHPVNRRLIKLAVQAYTESNIKQALVFKIEQHVHNGILVDMGPDTTLNKIEELLHQHIIDSLDVLPHRSSLGFSSRSDEDEEWDPSTSTSTNDWKRLTRDGSGPRPDARSDARANALGLVR